MVYSIAEAKTRFSELVKRAAYKGETISIGTRGKAEVVLISTAELEKLRQLEDERDARLLAEAVRTSPGTGSFPELVQSWERVHKQGRTSLKAKGKEAK
ncbi:MAG: type II toxin-antitoxin system Phd/YefM family antitoxin [Deltaproteobacteria bacterium]|nr:type II toxin-antitoxin system Phd/YefM family antitoxin [Deltaproteobacteria bacterium]